VTDFTGERVIPGQVEPDLWAEHLSRYRFASHIAATFARPPDILDLGSGAGYGTAVLAEHAASAVGLDIAPDAVAYARDHYPRANLQFLAGSVTDVPLPEASFDLVTAFEVIEHIADGTKLLAEARRVLRPSGLLLVSTPNTTYYAETRAASGPNPFHVREYTYDEFAAAIATVFPHAAIILQNHTDSFSFYEPTAAGVSHGYLEAASGSPADAHFFLAICSAQPLAPLKNFVYVPVATNLLRTREHHIALLQAEVDRLRALMESLKADLATAQSERDTMIGNFDEQSRELERRTEWALRLDKETEQLNAALKATVDALKKADSTVIERTEWALQLQKESKARLALLRLVKDSSWVRLGRRFGMGPKISIPDKDDDA
jgi:ubiquinone/menaquinone biosynthesis C-methylase UbiE